MKLPVISILQASLLLSACSDGNADKADADVSDGDDADSGESDPGEMISSMIFHHLINGVPGIDVGVWPVGTAVRQAARPLEPPWRNYRQVHRCLPEN